MPHSRAKSSNSYVILKKLGLKPGKYILATIHRAENTDDTKRLTSIFMAFETAAEKIPVLLPLHPRTKGRLKKLGLAPRKIRIIDPVGYLDMIMLEKNAALIATDSGGVQKEAFFYKVPCVTLRDETEWVELVKLGWNRLAKPGNTKAVAKTILSALGSKGKPAVYPYGRGNASKRIAALLCKLNGTL